MAPQETAKLDELLEQVAEHRGDFRAFRVEILGGEEDKPTARIPVLESTSRSHEKRLRRLEYFVAMTFGAAALLKVIGWAIESVAHILEIAR